MLTFEITVLGCGSALPTLRHMGSAQVVNIHEKFFLVDCAEGTQLQMRRMHLHLNRINHIFVTHLHGDHYLGIPGLISTMSLLGRTAPLHIFGPTGIEHLFDRILDPLSHGATYQLEFHPLDASTPQLCYEDRTMEVHTVPLNHGVPCCGYIFKEKPLPPHIRKEAIEQYQIPTAYMHLIKAGNDITLPDGTVLANDLLTTPAAPPRAYAYCTDTRFAPDIAPLIEGVDLLYHDATYAEEEQSVCEYVYHSTARQAATIAALAHARQLIIGHFSSRYDDETPLLEQARDVFPNTILANEGLTVAIAPRSLQ